MQAEIGATAGAIWHALDARGETTVAALKKELNGKSPIFDWAIGWLAREDKIVLTPERRAYRIGLKEARARAAGA
ncbi:MAG TPA: winged helix-turn-helix domain-containing protein [Candidatus Acidoferrales bacterium]|nr:winged helix-turn-helix domain-containing protein [Candidatus Acidoferrales bacterium]